MPHWRPVSVVLLTPLVPLALLPAMIRPGFAMVSDADVVAVSLRIEVEEAAVFLGEAAVPVVAHAGGERERRRDLKFVLHVSAKLVGAIVAAGVALQERADVEARSRAAGSHEALDHLAEVVRGHRARSGALVDRVQLRVAVAGAEADGVLAEDPDRIARRSDAVLEHAGIGRLSFSVRTDIQNCR